MSGPGEPPARRDPARPDQASPFKSRGGLKRLVAATSYSISGLSAAWRNEASFRQEVAVGVLLAPLAVWLAPTGWQALALVGAIVFVWLVELLNSAIEALADAVSLERHPLVGRAKDIGSAAVLLSLVLAAGVWLAVLWPVVAALLD
jgi:diacylglycerol kinase (ATP)